MGRPSKTRMLSAWMNGEFVGRWVINARGEHGFHYDSDWSASAYSRAISLSMPLIVGKSYKGNVVCNYFDNLLPDNERIRARIQQRFDTPSQNPLDLLTEIGRDCVGALQLLPEDEIPQNIHRIEAEPINDAEVERILAWTSVLGQQQNDEDFRISLAGAQDKTALVFLDGQWMKPHGATPTTHILKLPIGQHDVHAADLATSVENEWLCAQILDAYGIPVAHCWPQTFGDKRVLAVERFDRRLSPDGSWLIRLPQEDMCQAMGIAPANKYESQGGPGVEAVMNILLGSTTSREDRATFFKTQIIFWLLCAIDGHGKNFSVSLEAGGGYRLTPAYDVLSAYPVLGAGPSKLSEKKIKMAMAIRGESRHYHWHQLQNRYLQATAKACGMESLGKTILEETLESTPAVIAQVASRLYPGFPEAVSVPIFEGLARTAQKLTT